MHSSAVEVQQYQSQTNTGHQHCYCKTQNCSGDTCSHIYWVDGASSDTQELVDRLSHLGLSISYDRILRISAQLGSSVCELFHKEQVVCPPKLRGNVFTTAAVDNIDHNPSSTTAKESFHGTGISLFHI